MRAGRAGRGPRISGLGHCGYAGTCSRRSSTVSASCSRRAGWLATDWRRGPRCSRVATRGWSGRKKARSTGRPDNRLARGEAAVLPRGPAWLGDEGAPIEERGGPLARAVLFGYDSARHALPRPGGSGPRDPRESPAGDPSGVLPGASGGHGTDPTRPSRGPRGLRPESPSVRGLPDQLRRHL